MCQVKEMIIDNRIIYAADIKQKYIENIVDAASKCNQIDKVILFGSSLEDRCTEDSDVDIAVFGQNTKSKTYRSKAYEQFLKQIYGYDLEQDYDILYFKTGEESAQQIFKDILNGETLYVKD
ncbi:MAG: nucleotidyltransferase domain-containing protein [Butyrivibrio sp.]|uniref:nucleotidyltransferase domain-containing protein n=1 Tax=Butyrivibrio sp. TaxID=28121 RepID=UPI0025CBAE8D|nr:nucleotidyltransferase domain-containing protein [Butyrivibrio sp.]MCR5772224.1 nucleotidyltransferase domain-containing protein [Butyrivibrio sp.]